MIDLTIFENQFSNIYFDESSHSYKVDDKNLISVTTLLHDYSHSFDSDKISKQVAAKTGKKADDLKIEWKEKGESSSNKGKHLHKFIEEYILKKDLFKMDLYPEEKQYFLNFYEDFLKNKVIIYSEKILYNLEWQLAGTIDLLCYCPEEETLYFIDWKSNEKISTFNKYQKLKSPLSRYDQCSKEIYTLQLSLYRYMIEEAILNKFLLGVIKIKNILVHFSKLNKNYCIMELPYYKYSSIELLKHYNKNKKVQEI